MSQNHTPHTPRLLALAALATVGLGATGCDEVLKSVDAPRANFLGIDLLEAPGANKLARYACHEYIGSSGICESTLGSKPKKSNMRFSFDVVFDLTNPNQNFPIPLVETLIGMLVYPGQNSENLGALCVSFCDPDDDTCTPDADAEGACSIDDAKDVQTASDVVPTVDEMIELASDVANGTTEDNHQFRYIPADGSTEAHVQFDLNIDVMLSVMERVLVNAAEDALAGRNVNVNIPYESEGSVFFNVPQMGRYAVGYGPFEDNWAL